MKCLSEGTGENMALLESMQRALAEAESGVNQMVLYCPDMETRIFLAEHPEIGAAAQDAIREIRNRIADASIHVSLMCDPDTSEELLSIEIVAKLTPEEGRGVLREFMRNLPASVAAIEDSFLFSVVRA